MDQSPTSYTSVPLYDAEEELWLETNPEDSHDADTLKDHQDSKEEEEAALLNPALPSRTTRRLWLFLLCGLITTLALTSTCLVHSTLNAGKIYSIAVNRTAAVSELVHTFKVAGGGSLSMYRTRYNAGPESKEEITHTCKFESVCVQRRILEDGKKENEYWLIGTNDRQRINLATTDPVAADAFQHCIGTLTSHGSGHPLGIKSLANFDGEIRWMSGSTLAFVIPAPALTGFGAHTEWLQSWARFMSLIITLPNFMSVVWGTKGQFFRLVIFLDQTMPSDIWSKTILRNAYASAYAATLSSRFGGSLAKLSTLFIRTKEWTARHAAAHEFWDESLLAANGATCFDTLYLVAPSNGSFRDTTDADYFRKWVLYEADLPLERRIPLRARELKTVLLLRPDRPMWHHKRLVELLRQAGLHDIQTTAVVQQTTFESHAALWSNADLVITDDHDALSGQALMRPGTGIIEIFPPLLNDDSHRQIASRTGVHYYGLTSNGLVPEDIVQAEEPKEMETLRHAQTAANVTSANRCQEETSCQFAMHALGAYVEDGHFWNALISILEKIVPNHQCEHHRLSGANL